MTTCLACGSGALRRPIFSFLDCFVPPWRPFYPGQLEPTLVSSNPPPPIAPVSPGLLLCGSLSYSLPPNLSCSPLLFLSCCSSLLLSHCALPSLSLSVSLSLSLAPKKRGGRVVRCLSIPPGVRTILHGTEEVWCIHGATTMGYLHHGTMAPCAPLFFSFVSPPVMRIFFHMGVCSAACRGTARRPRVPGPPA